ncbi:MAG: phosphate ABC transporter permease PstA [Cytophagaceae bacterium]|nr:phosphate ABC transporter permease PstA [Cytophagaceae bacterium]
MTLKNRPSDKTRFYQWQDKVFKYFALCCTLIGLFVLALLLYNILSVGLHRLDWNFLNSTSSQRASNAGIKSAMVGTVYIALYTSLFALPIGISAAIYLEEYAGKNKFTNFLEVNIANLAGVPSVIYGLLGLEVFSRIMMLKNSILTGSLTLALLILPIIIVSTREALKSVPYSLREASYALGASKWQTIWHQVLPASSGGIFTGIILALSRAIGETAPLIVIGAVVFIKTVPNSIMDKFTVLPIQIFHWISQPQKAFAANAAAGIIVLLLITFLLNGIAVYLRYRWQKKIKW